MLIWRALPAATCWSEAYSFKLLGVSADGGVVSFHSEASDLVTGDFNGERDLFVRDLVDGATQLVSTFDSDLPVYDRRQLFDRSVVAP